MAYEDIQLIVEGFIYADTVEKEEQNFFSPIRMGIHRLGPINVPIDFMPVLTEPDLTVKKTFDNVDEENGKFTLIYETEEMKFKFINYEYLEGVFGEKVLASDIFKCFENSRGCKWLIRILHKGLPVWYGVAKPANVKYDNSDMTVNVSAYGIEAEFSEYYTNKTLVPELSYYQDDNETRYNFFQIIGGTDARLVQYTALTIAIKDNFPTPEHGIFDFIIGSSFTNEWYINDFPFFAYDGKAKTKQYPYLFIKGGYKKLVEENVTRMDWLSKTCNSMGWQFFFSFVGSTLVLHIIPRSRNQLVFVQQIDYNDINPNWTTGKQGVKQKFNYIEIPCGALTGGDEAFFKLPDEAFAFHLNPNDLKGNNISIISDVVNFTNRNVHFDNLQGGEPRASASYSFMKYDKEDDKNYYAIKWTSEINDFYVSRGSYYSIPKSELLRIDSGINDKKYIKVNLVQHLNHNQEDGFAVGDYDLVVKGCYGDCLFKRETGSFEFFTYQDYVLTEEFRLNFVPYLVQDKEIDVRFSVSGIFSNPYTTLEVYNGVPPFKGNYFATSEIETDYLNDTTTYNAFATKI